MELRHLRYFTAVAELENVSRAAVRLHVSQPALSRQIRDLEEELGFDLFERSAKSVRITEAGRVFLQGAREVQRTLAGVIATARAAAVGDAEELHVGYAPTLTARMLPPALRTFQNRMPRVRVKLHDLSTQEMLTGVREGKLALAITVEPSTLVMKGLRFEPCVREPLRLGVGPGHALATRPFVPLTEALKHPVHAYNHTDYPEYHRLLAGIFSSVRRPMRIAAEHDGVSSLVSALEAGDGVAVVPDSTGCVAGERLKLLPLQPEPSALLVGVVLPRREASVAALRFRESLPRLQ